MNKFFTLTFFIFFLPIFLKASPLSGTYTIGTQSSDFNSIDMAVGALNLQGISGNVVFNIKTDTYI